MAVNSAENQRRHVMNAVRRLEPAIAAKFAEAISASATDINFSDLVAAIESGDINAVLDIVALPEGITAQVAEQIRVAYSDGGAIASGQVPRALSGRFVFDGRHVNAEAWISQNVGGLIEGINESSLSSVRSIVTDGFESRRTSRSIALDITGRKVGNRRVGGVLGLNSDQTDGLINARHILSNPDRIREYFIRDRKTGRMRARYKLSDRRYDGAIRQAISEGRAITGSQLNEIIEAHRNKALGYRGRVIAKDQTFNAIAAGRDESYRQMAERDDVEKVTKRWQHNLSENARLDHVGMDGTTIDQDDVFVFPDGTEMRYPHDQAAGASHTIGCRCIAIYRIVIAKPKTKPKPKRKPTPAPTPEPETSFAYQRFKGVKSSKEAETYLLENGISGVVDLKGISPKGLGPSIAAAHEVTERFGLSPIAYFGPISRFPGRRIRTPRNANAAVYSTLQALHLPTKFGNLRKVEDQISIKTQNAERYGAERDRIVAASGARISQDVHDRIAQMKSTDYMWTITGADAPSEMARTIYHEYGHVLHLIDARIGARFNEFLASENPRRSGWQFLVSKYGGSNDKEYIAETFAIYMAEPESEHYRIHPKLLAIYKELDAKNDD